MGWLGMLVFLVMIGNGMWLGIRQLFSRTDDPPSWMALGIVIGMLSLWIQSLLEWAFRQTYLTVEYFMLAGFLAAMPRVVAASQAETQTVNSHTFAGPGGSSPAARGAGLYLSFPTAGIFLVAATLVLDRYPGTGIHGPESARACRYSGSEVTPG